MYVVTSQDEVSVSWYLVQQEPGEEAAEHGAEGAHHEEEADLAQRHPHLQCSTVYSTVQYSTVQAQRHPYQVLQVQQGWSYHTLRQAQHWNTTGH